VGDTDESNSTTANNVNNPSDDDYGTNDNAPTPSPTSPAQIESSSAREDGDEDQSDSESLTASSLPKAYGRFSPKTYNEMIKFVFTEHGIRVISDKEYVV
jgi:hypothetical protein